MSANNGRALKDRHVNLINKFILSNNSNTYAKLKILRYSCI